MWPQRDPHQACPPCLSIICHVSHVRHVPPHVNPPHRSGSESGQDKVSYQCIKSQLFLVCRLTLALFLKLFQNKPNWPSQANKEGQKEESWEEAMLLQESFQLMFLSTLASLFFSSSSAQATSNIHHDPQSKPHVIGDHLQHHTMISSFSQAHSSLPHGFSLQPTAVRSPILS